jgi:hypothetical protein
MSGQDVVKVAKAAKKARSAQLYAMRDGLSQVSWLCQVLAEYAQLNREQVDTEQAYEFDYVQNGVLEECAKGYKGTHSTLGDACKCFEQVCDDVRTFANDTRCQPESEWAQDEWGIEFLRLLDAFHLVFNEAINTYLARGSAATDADFETFTEKHEEIQEQLAALMQFTYDCDTKMKGEKNKQRIQRDYEWTNLCTICVWVTTAFDPPGLGPLDRLYAESLAHKEKLEKELQAFVLDCAVDAKNAIHDRRDDVGRAEQGGSRGAVRVKGATKKARAGGKAAEKQTQLTDLLGALHACL